jgi:hypothetical protein
MLFWIGGITIINCISWEADGPGGAQPALALAVLHQ